MSASKLHRLIHSEPSRSLRRLLWAGAMLAISTSAKSAEAQVTDGSAPRVSFTTTVHDVQPTALFTQESSSEEDVAAWEPKSYQSMTVNTEQPSGMLPRDYAAERYDQEAPMLAPMTRDWALLNYDWEATAFCHRPLYFEEPNLERYGYGCPWYIQPGISAAHFFGTVPLLPYLMASECPRECQYTLGQYRPGDCVPWRYDGTPARLRAALSEGGVVTGLIFLIP